MQKKRNLTSLLNDEDFIKLSMLFGTPLKVILLNVGNLNTSELAKVLIKNEQVIHQFVNHEEYGFLAIKQ
jgi:predicted nuclease of predicted toxin-antitoxin system